MVIEDLQLTFSESALEQLANELSKSVDYQYIRVGVKGGGCSGLTYILNLDSPTESDIHFQRGNIKFIIDKKHVMYLNGMHVDYHEGLNDRGFEFKNPNAKNTCGCGTSFSI
ncbi:MAG: iron-sulfur-binding protein [Bacteroidia bacterium]|nr:MAG: iron-sulfur-binding protein [Bacteroidia bacterium]